MLFQYPTFPFTKILGWSGSRYEIFDKCKRQYYYSYYANFVEDIPSYKIKQLKSLTSIPLEVGTIVHDIVETFLKRLQKSDSNIDENKFFEYARQKTAEYCSRKTFLEIYYKQISALDINKISTRVETCLRNFIQSSIYSWIYMKALYNKNNWMIEPGGYGETRLNGLKAYCKMDFLFPVDDHVYILDWKTGQKDLYKHTNQLIAYATAASYSFKIPWKIILPKIVYVYPKIDELEVTLSERSLSDFVDRVAGESEAMYGFCEDKEKNIPLSAEHFPMMPSETSCTFCNYQELCFPLEKRYAVKKSDSVALN